MQKQKIKTCSQFSFAKRFRDLFFVCNPSFGSSMGVQKEMGKSFFSLEIIGGHVSPPLAWNKLYQSPLGIGLKELSHQAITFLSQWTYFKFYIKP